MRRLFPGEQRPGYEFLGLLLLLQIATQSYLSLTSTNSESDPTTTLVENVLSPLPEDNEQATEKPTPTATNSPADVNVVLDLEDHTILPYIPSGSRRCPLCLDPMKDPTAGECGHLFCWTCILRWTGESAGRGECPICRGQCGREGILRLAG
jgi:peroxin-10